MGGDDFGWFLTKLPGALIRIGIADAATVVSRWDKVKGSFPAATITMWYNHLELFDIHIILGDILFLLFYLAVD